jgi:hypothetical protein
MGEKIAWVWLTLWTYDLLFQIALSGIALSGAQLGALLTEVSSERDQLGQDSFQRIVFLCNIARIHPNSNIRPS